VYVGGTAAAAPTNATAAMGTGWTPLGYISDDGVEEAYDDTTQDIRAWQAGTLVRRLITESSVTLHFTSIETNKTVLGLFYKSGDPSGGKLDVKVGQVDHRKFCLDVLDGTDVIRAYISDGEVTDRGNVIYKGDQPVGYEVTVTAYPDASQIALSKFGSGSAWT